MDVFWQCSKTPLHWKSRSTNASINLKLNYECADALHILITNATQWLMKTSEVSKFDSKNIYFWFGAQFESNQPPLQSQILSLYQFNWFRCRYGKVKSLFHSNNSSTTLKFGQTRAPSFARFQSVLSICICIFKVCGRQKRFLQHEHDSTRPSMLAL